MFVVRRLECAHNSDVNDPAWRFGIIDTLNPGLILSAGGKGHWNVNNHGDQGATEIRHSSRDASGLGGFHV
jgi:hypothetical protein